MPRFILRYRGPAPVRPEDVGRIRALPDCRILDTTSDRMILVDGPEEQLRAALVDMPGWIMIPEQTVRLPDPRRRVKHPPGGTEDENRS